MKVLIIGPSWIGDMMMSQSLYRTLKAEYPNTKIDVMTPIWCYPLLLRMPEVNEALVMPLGHNILELRNRYRIGKELRHRNYQHAYILPGSFKSALVPFFANIKKRTGWLGEMRYGLLNDIRILDKCHFPLMVERYVSLAYERTNIHSSDDLPQPLLLPRLQVKMHEKNNIASQFKLIENRPIIGLCPGSESGLTKCWPDYHYADLAQQLILAGYQIILLGSIKEKKIGEKIYQSIRHIDQCYCHNFIGKTTLEQAIILLSNCKIVITNDSGLMHIAAAFDLPIIALYGPSNPRCTPPLSSQARIICLNKHYKTYKTSRSRKRNIDRGYHQSLINILPSRVMEEINTFVIQ